MRKHGAKLIASAIITVSLVLMLSRGGLKFIPEGSNFDHLLRHWWYAPAYLLSLAAMSYFRASRWRFLLRTITDVPTKKLIAISWIGFAAILIMPFRLGELVRPYMLRSSGKVDETGRTVGAVTMSAATGSVVAERVVDALSLSIILAIALVAVPHIEPLPATVVGLPVSVARVRQAGFTLLGLFTIVFVVIAVFYAARSWAHKATLAVFGLVSKKLAEKLASIAENFADGLHFLGNARDGLSFLAETLAYWGFNAFGMWILAIGCGVVHGDGSMVTYWEACALMGMLGICVLIPGPPGLLGPFQLGVYAGMTMYYPTQIVVDQGAGYVAAMYVLTFVWTLGAAAWFLVKDPGAWRALEEAEGIVPAPPEPPAENLAA